MHLSTTCILYTLEILDNSHILQRKYDVSKHNTQNLTYDQHFKYMHIIQRNPFAKIFLTCMHLSTTCILYTFEILDNSHIIQRKYDVSKHNTQNLTYDQHFKYLHNIKRNPCPKIFLICMYLSTTCILCILEIIDNSPDNIPNKRLTLNKIKQRFLNRLGVNVIVLPYFDTHAYPCHSMN